MSLYALARDGNVERLRDALSSDSPAVRRRAAEFLGDLATMDDQATIDALLRAATGDEDEQVRGAAVDALDEIGQAAVEQLLGQLTGAAPEGREAGWVSAKKFAKALESNRPELRIAAVNTLGRLTEPSTLPAVVNALDDEDPRVRLRACHACGSFGDERAVPALERRLDDVPKVRRAAANALGTIATDRSLDPLIDLLDDGDESIRRIAASALGKANNPRPVEPLAGALADGSAIVRNAAVYSVIELLSNVPTQHSHEVRERVVTELRAADDATVVDPLVEILSEGRQRRQRRNAAWILGRVAGEESAAAVEALADALDDEDVQTAQFAATSLAELGGPIVTKELLDRIHSDVDDEARAKAVFVLGQVGGSRAREALEELTEDDSQAVRKRAFSAVSKLQTGGVEP